MGHALLRAVISALAVASQFRDARATLLAQEQRCPVRCHEAQDPSAWTLYNSVQRLSYCEEPTIFEVSLSAPLEGSEDIVAVRACTAGQGRDAMRISQADPAKEFAGRIAKRQTEDSGTIDCSTPSSQSAHIQLARRGNRNNDAATSTNAPTIMSEMSTWISSAKVDGCQTTVVFGHLNGTYTGFFSGPRIAAASSFKVFEEALAKDLQKGVPELALIQHCGASKSQASDSDALKDGGGVAVGLVVARDLAPVHEALRLWGSAKCVENNEGSFETDNLDMQLPTFSFTAVSTNTNPLRERQSIFDCRTVDVFQGDLCPALAKRCGISLDLYYKFNTAKDHCTTLQEGQQVCCTLGRLPDRKKPPKADGSCEHYTTVPDDNCSKIAISNGLTVQELGDINKKTWGWTGCNPLGLRVTLCIGLGTPPMPAAVEGASCGPTKPGTRPPVGDQTLADLNPCPLKACCNIWGNCGLTDDFCTVEKSKTGAPGTSGHKNGCIQNCERKIMNNSEKPAIFRKLGYFEAWNFNRQCLKMDVYRTMSHAQKYTDIHFSFGEISANFDPYIPADQMEQWKRFVKMKKRPGESGGVRKILAFGGWAFSTNLATYQRFPNVVKPENRVAFARKVATFAMAHNLDGIDFDWEYPGAPDLPTQALADQRGKDEGANYLAFLQEVRKVLPSHMTLSIAAPASYWYLKAFPIARMAQVLDYIVYMTYDLHGQWDFGNMWSSPGCPQGNCLRSHVNNTETEEALIMITKAGVPAHKILVGVATYGRSFKMSSAGCTGPMCTFLGPKISPAAKGVCTNEPGYLALAEINKIIKENPNAKYWYDTESESNMMVYNRLEWVAYMDDNTRRAREAKAFRRNFGGTIEWAVDLQEELNTNHGPEGPPRPIDASETGAYLDVTCEYGTIKNASAPPHERWNDALAHSLWLDVVAAWKERGGSSGLTFTEFVSDFTNARDVMECEELVVLNGCTTTFQCDETRGNFRPASFLLLNSFIGLNKIMTNMYLAIESASNQIQSNMENFRSRFMPPEKDQLSLSIAILLDIFTMGYASSMAVLWNKGLAKGTFAQDHENTFQSIKDATNDLTYNGAGLAKDIIAEKDKNNELPPEDKLRVWVSKTTELWLETLTVNQKWLFNGEKTTQDDKEDYHGLNTLGMLIGSGSSLRLGAVAAFNGTADVRKTLYADMIPLAWRVTKDDRNPFILDSGLGCDDSFSDLTHYMEKDLIESDMVCIDGRAYFLAGTYKSKDLCHESHLNISCPKFRSLPGSETLNEDSVESWSVITREIIVKGSLNTYKANGYVNKDWKEREPTTDEAWKKRIDEWQVDYDKGEERLEVPGTFTLPVCAVREAWVNQFEKHDWSGEDRGANFPCP